MDLLPSPLSQVQQGSYFSWPYMMVTLWTFQNLFLSGGNTASVALNRNVSSSENSHVLTGRPLLGSVSSALVHPNDDSGVSGVHIKRCDQCKIGGNGKVCSGENQGECDCSSENVFCLCKAGWAGDTCQYKISKVNCEKMWSCILCRVHKTGPLADEKDCHFYCDRSYPTPLIVKTLHFQDDEHLCSFIQYRNWTIKSDCRYFFKYGKLTADGSLVPSNFYIVAQQDMVCGKPAKFPQLLQDNNSSIHKNDKNFHEMAKDYETAVKGSDHAGEANLRKNSFLTIVIVFIFIALPFVTCIFALIYNFSNLPCGLCNIFRQSSSKYLRNVRPFPGYAPAEQTTQL